MPGTGALSGRKVLLVEDEFLVGEVIVSMLEDEEAEVLGTASSVQEALDFIARRGRELDHAVLDINLRGAMSYPVADALEQQGVPFVFVTGYSASAIEEKYRAYPRCLKPVASEALIETLQAGMAGKL